MSELVPYVHLVEPPSDAPLLTYALLPTPDPLLASGPAKLTLVVSYSGSQFVTVTSIAVTLPIGTNAKNLTASASGIGTTEPTGWGAAQSGGIFTFTPSTPANGQVGPDGLAFVLTGITVNDQPGTCAISIDEEAAAPGKSAAHRTTKLPVAKFPATFALGDLTATPSSLASGESAVLLWNGSPATYVLSYDPDGNGDAPHSVGPNGPYTARNLTAPVVVFTLVANVTVPGDDTKLTTTRQAVVTVVAGSVALTALPSIVGVHGLTRLAWQTTGTTSRTLDPGGTPVVAIGVAYAIVKQTTVFTLRATVPGKAPLTSQQTVTVDPSIVPTQDTGNSIGVDGVPGYGGDEFDGGIGGQGGQGGPNPSLTLSMGPLDPSSQPAQVGRILLRAGRGGRGGKGGDGVSGLGGAGPGGDGGPGGDTNGPLTITFDSSSAPQQLIIDIQPGPGGDGGPGGNSSLYGKAPDGKPGRDGAAAAPVIFKDAR